MKNLLILTVELIIINKTPPGPNGTVEAPYGPTSELSPASLSFDAARGSLPQFLLPACGDADRRRLARGWRREAAGQTGPGALVSAIAAVAWATAVPPPPCAGQPMAGA